MMIRGIKRWFKKEKKETSNESVSCKNCETGFKGNYCPEFQIQQFHAVRLGMF